ncbi:MAG: GTP 3',8-cyclase MoaA [Actinomycetia bacterium]|nr:GTP 3',8-cyclase MoaA [Actinomycetes bacterium]
MTTLTLERPGAAAGPVAGPLVDRFGRVHTDLRVSVTDRCSLRCSYCMPEHGVPLAPASFLLDASEIVRLVGIATRLGVTQVRLTGGEPLLRADLVDIVAGIAGLPARPEVSLTTNGLGLARLAGPLAAAGLGRVNVSLDSVDRVHYAAITRRDRLDDVLAGLEAARAVGLDPIKLNAVLLRGVNEADAVPLLDFALARGYELRFIEQMPLDGGHTWRRAAMIGADEILARLGASHRLTPLDGRGAAPAARWLVDDGPGVVGVIAAVTRPFCGACERVRLTADGCMRNCLFARGESDLREALRDGATDAELADMFRACVAAKRAGHGIGEPGFAQPTRPMSAIGG